MLGELRYLAGIRCELGKTALALAPVLSPLYRPSRCRPPGAGPQLQAPRHRPQAQAPRRRLARAGPPGVGLQVWRPLVQAVPEQALGNASPCLQEVSGPLCPESGGGLGCLHVGVG